jgi:alpha-1,3-rhamnosyl/mannosyltransferase
MACGTPVVCSAAGSLPEVVGDAALIVDPDDDVALAAAVSRALAERGAWRSAGLAQAARFSWTRCAELTVAAYAEAAA